MNGEQDLNNLNNLPPKEFPGKRDGSKGDDLQDEPMKDLNS